MYVLAIVCPPFAALIAGTPRKAVVNLLLTLCLWVPGIIHAFSVIKEAQNKHDDLHEYASDSQKAKSYRQPRIV
jgi:uncharacterized membrane protein YqaE (UPF0057 family)